MADTDFDAYYAFDAGAGSGVPTEDVWEETFKHVLLDGVLAGEPSGTTPGTTELQPYGDSTGLQVKIRVGRALMKGHIGWITAEKTLAVATADATNPRIDNLVIRLDRTNNTIQLGTVAGTAAASPVAPSLTQSSVVHEEKLAEIDVAAGATTIAAADVRDMRRWAIPDSRGLPSVRATRGTNQTGIATFTDTLVTWSTTSYQTGGVWLRSATPTRLYAPRPGLYSVVFRAVWDNNTNGQRQLALNRAGTVSHRFALVSTSVGASGDLAHEVSGRVVMADGDYLEAYVFQTSGADRTLTLTSYGPALEADLIRAI